LPSNAELQGQGSRLRTPFFSVILNNSDVLTGVLSFEVTNASHFAADTYKITCALAKLPPGLGAPYWSSSSGDQLEISAGFKDQTGQGTPKSLIVGVVDDVVYDPITQMLELSGRDLSSRFIDARTAENFQDQVASNVAKTLAARRGLQASVAATTTRVGTYYELYDLKLTKEQCEWDLLKFLAEQEGFDLWVSGQTLNFQPPVPLNADTYNLIWSDLGQGNRVANFENLQCRRSQTLAQDVIVKVTSWNQAQGANVTAEAHRTPANKSQRAGGKAQIYTFYPPNLNKQQADKFAASKAEDITRHERVITGKLPGDNLMSNRSLIKLAGTGTDFDQAYFVDSVTRRMSVTEGYAMEFRAKNHSTQSTV
jgi:phage protein D